MRNLVEPPPSTHCERCDGELLFKRIEPDNPDFDIDIQVFVCARCGREHSRRLIHEPYNAHTARGAERRAAGSG
jgi:DNA-directed RNA polymerase subunit RPC12/RpoP